MVETPGEVVIEADLSFRAIGIATPAQFRSHVVPPGTDVVLIDAVRCSSTLLGVLAAGARGIVVKSKASMPPGDAAELVQLGGREVAVLLAGELHGKPLPGAAFGNSVLDLPLAEIAGRIVQFSSTNFGAMWEQVLGSPGARDLHVFVASFANAGVLGRHLAVRHRRLVLCLGGFYNRSSIEDHVVAGRILRQMAIPFHELDDDARLMLLAAEHLDEDGALVEALESNRIGTALARFGRTVDIRANVLGDGVDAGAWRLMQRLVPTVHWVGDVPILVARKELAPTA